MEKLKFKENVDPILITEDFYYMIGNGGWAKPENYLEEDDAKRVREAITLIRQYEKEGYANGCFEEF